MKFFTNTANLIPEYKQLLTPVSTETGHCGVNKTPQSTNAVRLSGLSRIHKAHLTAAIAATACNVANNASLLVLVETENEAVRMCDDVNTLLKNMNNAAAMSFPAKDYNFAYNPCGVGGSATEQAGCRCATIAMGYGDNACSPEYVHRRIATLTAQPAVIIATAESAAQMTYSPTALSERIIIIKKDSELNTQTLLKQLVDNGYNRVEMVESVSQYSVRGSIIDIYPVGSAFPIRIDLWGDTVEGIGEFDIESQRTLNKVTQVEIPPAFEPCTDSTGSESAQLSSLFDYVQSVIVCERRLCAVQHEAAYKLCLSELKMAAERGADLAHDTKLMLTEDEYEAAVTSKAIAYLDMFGSGRNTQVAALPLPTWHGDYAQLKSDLAGYGKKAYSVVIFAGTEKSARSLALDLRDDGFKADYTDKPNKVLAGHIFVTYGTLSGGFDYPAAKCACITHTGVTRSGVLQAFERQSVKKAKKKSKSEAIRALTDINVGDYIVHDIYGIGIFEGVTRLEADGASKDYIKLKYAGKDVLYVPVTQLDFIARYIGNTETVSLKLSKLGTDSWSNAKAKAKKAAEELAEELIELYKRRLAAKGHAFGPDTPLQHEFESRFPYIETDDQLTCIEQIKRDMQKPQPMDRLLCGDVGFGKTEVALRAAFKCVSEGKQCALLCPTTVLAWQHYQTAMNRMSDMTDWSVNIELLSRFRSAKEKREVLKGLESGVVDFVIGTHSLIGGSKRKKVDEASSSAHILPVKFKNLGLVIIDEEQRFGVKQKERFKEAFPNIDILTLSATPIPRTLNMAMSGIRDMSTIATPPQERSPVTTYVCEHDNGVIAQAIQKELRRAGQVYYLHNRVETILDCAAMLHKLVPEARIGIAHGKMDEQELLDVWRKLIEREIDVLVCTTLIETGVDVPNVNTLIIERADRMGLAQLHQLRGRVGRTNRRGYAYFTYRKGDLLNEIQQKRLSAVREFTQFGAGFKIAMRDMEIRGAGNVLGESQSGHLSAVGYEMYVRLLEEAIIAADTAREESDDESGTGTATVDIKADAYIPDSYISHQAGRISCYKRIAEIRTDADADDVADELTDRYGTIPRPVSGLIDAARIRNLAAQIGISEITQRKLEVALDWECPDMKKLSKVPDKYFHKMSLNFASAADSDGDSAVGAGNVNSASHPSQKWGKKPAAAKSKSGVTLKLVQSDDVVEVVLGFLSALR